MRITIEGAKGYDSPIEIEGESLWGFVMRGDKMTSIALGGFDVERTVYNALLSAGARWQDPVDNAVVGYLDYMHPELNEDEIPAQDSSAQ